MKRLLLVGAGHAHLEIVRRFSRERPGDLELTVVSLEPRHYYSGMVPGFLNGTYSERQVSVEVESLVRRAGGNFRVGRAVRLDRGERHLELEDGEQLGYDLVSFNLGSGLVGTDLPGVREHALLIKPLSNVVRLREELRSVQDPSPTAVVGGGAAGVEIAFSLESMGRKVTIVDAGDSILSGYGVEFRRRVETVLAERGIEVRTGAKVASLSREALQFEDGTELPATKPAWLTGPRAPRLFRDSELTTDSRGFLLIDDTLRHVADERIFGVGDCATLLESPDTPKAGVYAVRQGPVLWEGILAAARGGRPPIFAPQKSFLSLLNSADGKAFMRYGNHVSHSRPGWWLKDFIDRAFMRKYNALDSSKESL